MILGQFLFINNVWHFSNLVSINHMLTGQQSLVRLPASFKDGVYSASFIDLR